MAAETAGAQTERRRPVNFSTIADGNEKSVGNGRPGPYRNIINNIIYTHYIIYLYGAAVGLVEAVEAVKTTAERISAASVHDERGNPAQLCPTRF